MTNRAISFWDFIGAYYIEIPIIQRDYAQGRLGKEYLRKNFLSNIKQALDNNDSVLKLDFVYGTERNGKLYPLDGQQRLTTLWLLHWYVALKAGTLEEASERLKKFTYETRVSSREFCQNLCVPRNFGNIDEGDGMVDFITSRTWFYSSWKQDPTIQAMLRMIEGTKISDKRGDDIVDGMEELFKETESKQFKVYWERLTSGNAPIVFYYLPLKDFGLADDLYIKMNARGKQLTPFENFKADLIGYIEEQATGSDEWKRLLDSRDGIPVKIDSVWTDLFWDNKTGRLDEAYFAFLNRFFWNELFTAKDSTGYVLNVGRGKLFDGRISATVENENASYNYLNKDDYDVYMGLEPYKYVKGDGQKEIPLSLFRKLHTVLDNYLTWRRERGSTDCNIPVAKWVHGFEFIPQYAVNTVEGKTLPIKHISQIQRIAFFAVCKYFKEGSGDAVSLRRWMRVVWNLISGEDEAGDSQIRDLSAMRRAVSLIDSLDSHNVYESLCEKECCETGEDSALLQRYREEVVKANQIIHCKYNGRLRKENGLPYETWEELIVEAEGYAFFKGSIRFLFRNAAGKMDWSSFEEKWGNVKQYFSSESKSESALLNGSNDAGLLKALISRFTKENFDKVLWWCHRTFNNKPASWKYYLLNNDICGPVDQLLRGGKDIQELQVSDDADFELKMLYSLVNTKLLDYVVDKIPGSWIRSNVRGHTAIYQSSTGVFLDAQKRNSFLLHTDGIEVADVYKIPGTEFLYGWDINFRYYGKNFQWYETNFIYLMENDDPNAYVYRDESKTDETEKYYCFDAGKITKDEIIRSIQALMEIEDPKRLFES